MFPVTSTVTCVRAALGVYRLYHQGRRVGEAVTIDDEAPYPPTRSPRAAAMSRRSAPGPAGSRR
jgi:hypothetical protein